VAAQANQILSTVISSGTAVRAKIDEFAAGKTGTTENYGDAWFCGFIDKYTTCVWVGYADNVKPMEYEYNGGPVAGGTWPAVIWQSFMLQAIDIRDVREAEKAAEDDDVETTPVPITPVEPAPAPAPTETAPVPAPAETGVADPAAATTSASGGAPVQ
jgi:penicillin-binding protein 1A